VTGAEISLHMCDVAAETVVMNGQAAKCIMINKDVRRLHSETLPDGRAPDMAYKANLCIFEVCAAQLHVVLPASLSISTKSAISRYTMLSCLLTFRECIRGLSDGEH